jgi:hypothetical protein
MALAKINCWTIIEENLLSYLLLKNDIENQFESPKRSSNQI